MSETSASESASDRDRNVDRLPVANARTVWREARRSLAGRRWQLAALAAVLTAAAAAGIVSPLALGAVVDGAKSGVAADDPAFVWMLGGWMAASILLGALLGAVGVIGASRLIELTLADLRERMVDTAFRLPQARVERAGTGDLISRAGDDVAVVAEAIPSVVPALAGSFFTIAVTIVGMAVIDPWYALVLLVVVPVHALAVRGYLRHAPQVYAGERAAMADRAQHLLDSLRGLESVRAYGLAYEHIGRIARVSWAVAGWTMRARAIQNVFFARLNVAELLGMGGLLVVGFVLVSNGSGSIGGTTAAMLLFLRLFGPINELLFVVDDLQSALASLGRIVGVITADEKSRPTHTDEAEASGTVSLTGVTHSYIEGHDVLRDIQLELSPGETVAVVGASGAGKSTLAALVAGVHEPVVGSVQRAGSVVLVTQEVHVFDATLRANLTLARADASDTMVLDALGRVGASRLVSRLAAGLDEPVGSAGTAITPAEAQHVALARVLLADPELVILDEATAEGGSRDADRLDRAAAEVGRGRTVLIVAHRLSQAATADRVVLMHNGRIQEQGTHADLVTAGGPYAHLWKAWSGDPPAVQ
ncbi:ATP-binding cassette, subfamily C [Agreia bicolorata]|uniref:ATP-binding cassette, subfamily C n=1 Tax=Agreia bicolorata TaxID=110935 RepID=A0A1T4YE94_9MICO|nr:ABC transporter ATP-binding protein [Agreia bicolorata]SKB00157.1 ATP-binding cassette, subfamily C [Agreia bicolorata]